MHDESSHGAGSRERVAQNVYRRRTKRGELVYEVDVPRRRRPAAPARGSTRRNERAAIREARALLAQRDGGDRVVAADLTLRDFVERDYLPTARGARRRRPPLRARRRPRPAPLRLHVLARARRPAARRDRARRRRRAAPLDARARSSPSRRCTTSLTVLRAVYRLARSRRLVTRSPVDELDPAELPRPRAGTSRPRLDERAARQRSCATPTSRTGSAWRCSPTPGCGSPRRSRCAGATSTSSSSSSGSPAS